MCQAYEGEAAYIRHTERLANEKGYIAAEKGEPQESNPYAWDIYRSEAWDHGWQCFREGLDPWWREVLK